VSGIPLDSKNGFIQDFYATGAGFMLQVALVETVLPPLLSLAVPDWRFMRWLYGSSGSAELRQLVAEPPPYLLAERCASLMRIVIICCAFSSGFPLLNFATALCIAVQFATDRYALTHIYRKQPAGPELPRSIEVVLVSGMLLSALMSWLTLRTAWADSNVIVKGTLLAAVLAVLLVGLGYSAGKCCRGGGGGGGGVVAGGGGGAAGRRCRCCCTVPEPVRWLHSVLMTALLGRRFFQASGQQEEELEQEQEQGAGQHSAEKSSEATYSALSESTPDFLLPRHPYAVYERAQLGLWGSTAHVAPRCAPLTVQASMLASAAFAEQQQQRGIV
jgi:hypothetical protein